MKWKQSPTFEWVEEVVNFLESLPEKSALAAKVISCNNVKVAGSTLQLQRVYIVYPEFE